VAIIRLNSRITNTKHEAHGIVKSVNDDNSPAISPAIAAAAANRTAPFTPAVAPGSLVNFGQKQRR